MSLSQDVMRLIDLAVENGLPAPSIPKLAELLGRPDTAIRGALETLAIHGHVVRVRNETGSPRRVAYTYDIPPKRRQKIERRLAFQAAGHPCQGILTRA